MTSHLLVSLVFLLAVDLASPHAPDDRHPGMHTTEDQVPARTEEDVIFDISSLDDVHDEILAKRAVDEIPNLKNAHDWSLAQEAIFVRNLPRRIKEKIERLTKSTKRECKKVPVSLKNRKAEKERALRKNYQAYQRGEKEFITDKQWQAAADSEKCSTCVLDKLCQNITIQDMLFRANLSSKSKEKLCRRILIRQEISKPIPPANIKCDPNAKYRTIDGTCNNLRRPRFGAANGRFLRITQADYGDGISTLRLSADDKKLTNARHVSSFVHGSNADRKNPNSGILTHIVMNFGQFMDHDITLAGGQGINCEPPTTNPECINIEIPKGDAIFRKRKVDFIEMERDAPFEPTTFCKLVVREHKNTITAFVDASNVYGSTKKVADSLRAPDGLLLEMKHPHGCHFKNLLPAQTEGFCPSLDPNRPCFLTGDVRNNENPGLNSVHTIYVRQHNRIATFFGKKTDWGPEKIYQETRRIIGAQLQVITYGEFLPLLLSKKTMKRFRLELLKGKRFSTSYNNRVNAQMSTAFAVAAYRFGHSLVQEIFNRFTQDGFEHKCSKCDGKDKSEFLPIPVLDFNNPQYLYDSCKGGIDSIMRGLVKDPAGKIDGRFSSSVQENLRRGEGDLSDLVAINIQRGRERGLAGYTRFRNLPFCKLPKVKTFKDLITVAYFDPKDVEKLKKVYDNVSDVDLFVGGLLEPKDPHGGLLGPTFQCIIAEQFRRLKIGDRFWHENKANPSLKTDKTAFTSSQLQEIRKTSFAKIICENSDHISAITRRVLQQSKIRILCNDLPDVNLEPWIEKSKSNRKLQQDANDDPNKAHHPHDGNEF